jgi:hypothetical protein
MSRSVRFGVILIFILAFAVRFVDLGTHFTHYDDVVTAVDILKAKEPNFKEQLLTALYDQTRSSYNNKQKVLARRIYENPQTKLLFEAGVFFSRIFIMSIDSTYAPVQFLLTPLLIYKTQAYRTIILFNRLPSFIFSLLTIWLMYLSLKKRTNPAGLLAGLLLCALSLESIIYAKQAVTYSIGCAAAAGLLLLFQESSRESFFKRRWLLSGFLTTLFAYSHYQVIFFLPAYYLTHLLYKYSDRTELKYLIFSGLFNFLLCLPVLYFLFFLYPSGLAGYTIGLHGEFLFSPDKNIFIFLLKNSFLVIAHTLSPVAADKVLFWILGGLFCAGFLSGLKKIFKQPEGLFIIFSLLTCLGLVIMQKLALTPTRQALIYLPFFSYVIAQGMPELRKKYLAGILFIYTGLFLFFFPGFIRERQDKIKEAELTSLIKQYEPDLIIGYSYTLNGNLLSVIKNNYNYLDSENLILHKPPQYKTLAFLSTRHKLDENFFINSQRLWNNKQNKPLWTTNYAQYKVIYQKISTSNIEIEPNYWNHNGSNNLFFYILSL